MGAPAPPGWRKKLGVIYRENLQCTASTSSAPPGRHILLCGVDLELQLVVLDRLLKVTTKKVANFFEEKSASPNKILATAMLSPTDGAAIRRPCVLSLRPVRGITLQYITLKYLEWPK